MNKKVFLRSFKISFILIFNLILLFFGICRVYENVRELSFGEYVDAVEINKNGIRILDFEIKKEQFQ